MFKRLFWLTTGATLGFGCSVWVRRALRQTVQRFTPERVAANATSAVQGIGAHLKAAASEGRAAMREREAQLRAELQH